MTPTSKVTLTSPTNADSYTTGSFTPSSDCMLVAFVSISDILINTVTVSGGGLTWTRRAQVDDGAGSSLYIFTAPVVSSPGSMTFTADSSADPGNATGCLINVIEVTGVSPTIVQTATVGLNTTITLGGAMNTNNLGLLGAVRQTNPATITEPSGWTELVDIGHPNPTYGLETSYKNTGATSSSLTVSASSTMAFIELQPGTMGSAAPLNTPFLMFV